VAVIDQYRNILTLMIEIDVTPEECDAQVVTIKNFLNEVVKTQPGFISSNLHVSLEKDKIVNYAQWKNESDYQAFLENEEVQKLRKKILKSEPRTIWMKVVHAS
jgi:quinol monooxygenase YgiN